MAHEEEAGYALASWERFDTAMTDDLLRAVTSAFAMIAVADGDLARSEVDRFMLLIRERAGVLEPLDMVRVERVFHDITGALLSDPAAGRRRALTYIAAVADNAAHRELVQAAARIAIAADDRELATEGDVLREICAAMEAEPDQGALESSS